MYKDFISEGIFNIRYATYRKVCDKENIGFGSPTQDECDSAGSEQVEAEKSPCENYQKYDIHKTRYTVARQKYNGDSSKKWTSDFEIFLSRHADNFNITETRPSKSWCSSAEAIRRRN